MAIHADGRRTIATAKKSPSEDLEHLVSLAAGKVTLSGDLAIPDGASGIVLFAHGSGSSRQSSRNRFVARALQDQGLATLLFDFLTSEEESVHQFTAQFRFDIKRITKRLVGATDCVAQNPETEALRIGYFGASTGAAAASVAATQLTDFWRTMRGVAIEEEDMPHRARPKPGFRRRHAAVTSELFAGQL